MGGLTQFLGRRKTVFNFIHNKIRLSWNKGTQCTSERVSAPWADEHYKKSKASTVLKNC